VNSGNGESELIWLKRFGNVQGSLKCLERRAASWPARRPKPFQEMKMKHVTTEKLMTDLQLVVTDAEELLKATAGQAGDKVAAVRARTEDSIRNAKTRLAAAGEALGERSREAARHADEFVHENPWNAIGVAAGIGLLLGFMIGRK
jgi:ElaB/YqjD/DUF883 family membrane-anchored ribosome-binding protein